MTNIFNWARQTHMNIVTADMLAVPQILYFQRSSLDFPIIEKVWIWRKVGLLLRGILLRDWGEERMVSRDYNTIMRLRLCCMRGRDASIATTIQLFSNCKTCHISSGLKSQQWNLSYQSPAHMVRVNSCTCLLFILSTHISNILGTFVFLFFLLNINWLHC